MSILTDNGIIRFYDGTIIAIESQAYSPDGISNWETTFNPNTHISTLDGVTIIDGHRYKKVKHSGDTDYQLPYRIIPEETEFQVTDLLFQYKLETETEWTTLLDLEELQGEDGAQGEQGIQGEGLEIDIYGYYTSRPDCTASLGSSSCTTCNTSASSSNDSITFMSLGDGTLVLTSALIVAGTVTVDSVAYSHFSNDLITWVALTGGIVDFEARYLATDGTGAVYTDMRTENYYGTQGLIYVCADGTWVLHSNIATPSYMVGERTGSTNIGFLNQFIDDTLTEFLSNTIGITDGKLEIAEQSITEAAFATSIVGDGLEIPTAMDPIQVAPVDFAGYGLSTYTSDADSNIDIQVNVTALIGNGVTTQTAIATDGETANLFGVNVNDLINNDSGLIATAETDTFYDLYVNLGYGLILDGGTPQAITVNVDDLSLEVDSTDLHIKVYSSGNDGVMKQHLNPDIIWSNTGLGFDTSNGLYARIDNLTIGYDGSGNLEVPLNGLTGDRLNDDVADNDAGLAVSNDMLVVQVDGSTIGFNTSGQLEYIGLSGLIVSSITPQYNGTPLDLIRDDITMNYVDGTGINLTVSSVSSTDVFTFQADIDTTWFDNRVNSLITSGATVYWEALEQSISDTTTISEYIDSLEFAILNTWYNNAMLSDGTGSQAVAGLLLKSVGGTVYRLVVDDEGNTDTVAV